MDHCVSAFLKSTKEEAYKIYMSDIGYNIANALAVRFGAQELPIQKRYCELFNFKKKAEEKPQETAEEIIERMREKARKL